MIRRRTLTAVIGLGLTGLPLVGNLGYEHAFVLGPMATLGGVGVGIADARAARARDALALGTLARAGARELAILSAIAFAMPLVGSLWQRSCEPLGGAAFFAMGPMICAALGWVCGIWAGALARSDRRAMLLGLTPMIVSTAIGLWRLYAHPVVFAFDPFWGYFSGSVYDEAVSVGPTYLRFRGYNALGAAAALVAFAAFVGPDGRLRVLPRREVVARLGFVALLALPWAAIGLRGSHHGFTADRDSITEVLSSTLETEHFVIRYAPRSADAREIAAIGREHEFAWATLRARMNGREPSGKVESFVFPSTELKRRLMGAGTVQVAAPWRRQIYLDHRPFPHPVLHHELAHVFGATVGDSLLGISRSGLAINIGLIEGFATAMAPREAERLDLHDQAKVLRALGKLPELGPIMGAGFFGKSSQVAYTAAGSFCLYLLETRGFEPLGVLYQTGGDFERAYGGPLAPLEAEWIAFLDARTGVRDEDVAAAAQRFRRTSVFERPCAHRAAEVRSEIERASARGQFDEAIGSWRELCRIEPEQPEHGLGLAGALAIAGELDGAAGVLDELARTPDLTATILAAIAERRGDVELARGDRIAAAQAYAAAMAQPQGESRLRLLQLRIAATDDPELTPLVLRYLAPFDADGDDMVRAIQAAAAAAEIARLPRHQGLGNYLLARQLLNVQGSAAAAGLLVEALAHPDSLPSPEMIRAARIALLEADVIRGEFARARSTLATLRAEPDLGHGQLASYDEWAARIVFFAGE